MSEEYLTVKEVAAKLRKHPDTIRNWMRRSVDPLPYVKIAGSILIRRETLDEYVRNHVRIHLPRS